MPKLDYTKTGERVRRFRKEKGWSQEELARKGGISQNFVGQIERGTRSMSLDTFARLCTVLEIGADSLLCENTEPSSYAMYVKIIQSAAGQWKDLLDRETIPKKNRCGRENNENHSSV